MLSSAFDEDELVVFEEFLRNPDSCLYGTGTNDTPSVEFQIGDSARECRIWESYFDASCILLRRAYQRQYEAIRLIFPALFNLRHATEIALKWHIRYAGGTVPKTTGHNLNALVRLFRQTAEDLDDEATYISHFMLDRVLELSLIDPCALTFRYSTDLGGSPINIQPQRLDLHSLLLTAEALSLWFDGLSDEIASCRG